MCDSWSACALDQLDWLHVKHAHQLISHILEMNQAFQFLPRRWYMGLFLSLVTQACQSLAENHPLYRVSITMGWFWVAEESVGVVWILIWDSIKVR